MISVVIPLYNKEKQVAKTLQTVLSQTYQNFEIVIVNDGSTDGSVSEVERFKDSRIRIINQKNGGVSSARNRGIHEAKGKYVAFLDADDEWDKDYLLTINELVLSYSDCSIYATRYRTLDKEGVSKNIKLHKWNNEVNAIMGNYFEIASCSAPPLWTSAVCVKKEDLLTVGGFPQGVKSGEDLLTWARLAVRYRIAYSNKVLATFYVEQEKVTDKPKRIPAEVDYVGQELIKILYYNKGIKGLKRYIANWKKMRSSNFMRLNMRYKSIKEALLSIWYYPLNYKVYLYIVYNMLPHK